MIGDINIMTGLGLDTFEYKQFYVCIYVRVFMYVCECDKKLYRFNMNKNFRVPFNEKTSRKF